MNISISILIIFGTVFLMGEYVLARTLETGRAGGYYIHSGKGEKYANEDESVELDSYHLLDLGQQNLNKGDMKRAASCFRKSAEFENANAQWRLGDCYFMEKGIREDKQEAVKWYRLSAEQGNKEVISRLKMLRVYKGKE